MGQEQLFERIDGELRGRLLNGYAVEGDSKHGDASANAGLMADGHFNIALRDLMSIARQFLQVISQEGSNKVKVSESPKMIFSCCQLPEFECARACVCRLQSNSGQRCSLKFVEKADDLNKKFC